MQIAILIIYYWHYNVVVVNERMHISRLKTMFISLIYFMVILSVNNKVEA